MHNNTSITLIDERTFFDLANPKMIGDKNKASIIRLVRAKGPISRADIARQLNLSPPAVSNNINALLEAGIIKEIGTYDSSVGRKPVLLCFNSTFGYVLGIDIGEYKIRCGVANLDGDIIDFNEVPTMANEGGEFVLKRVNNIILSMLEKNRINNDKILAAGIGSPGIKNVNTGTNILAPFIKSWDQINIKNRMEEKFKFPFIVENDVDMSIIGEYWKGAGRNYENMAYIKLGDGVAARFILNGRLYRGINFAAGEIGFMLPDKELIQDRFCEQGALEKLICNDAIASNYKNKYEQLKGKKFPDEDISISDVLKRWEEGDDIANLIVEDIKIYLGIALINIISILNPEVIILGGQLSDVPQQFIVSLKDMLSKHVLFIPEIIPAQLGNNAGVIGAIAVALAKAEKLLSSFWE